MKAKFLLPTMIIPLLGLLLGACIPGLPIIPAVPDNNLEQTAAAQTVQAHLTEAAVGTLAAQITQAAEQNQATATQNPPTATVQPPTETATPTATATSTTVPPTATQLPPTPTPVPCYAAQFIKDVTFSDGTEIAAGNTFTKTWRLKNNGACVWTKDFDLVFVSGSAMDGPAVVDFPAAVNPGESIDLSVQLVAPKKSGTYRGYWQLRTTNGTLFGLGVAHDKPFWVEIDVPSDYVSIDPNSPLDFAASYAAASWYSAKGSPSSSDNYVNGSIYRTTTPKMEKEHTDDEPTLIMIPSEGQGGQIYGQYPAVNIQNGDRLRGIIGCTSDSPECNVMIQINYRADGGSTQNLGSWTEVYDGNWTFLDIDLSTLAGKSVQFTLLVFNNGSSKDDRVFWLAPKIVR